MEYRFAYATLVAISLSIWCFIYASRRDLRREMVIMTSLIGVLGVTQMLYVDEYWTPEYVFPISHYIGIEDFLLAGFFYGGLGSVLYQFVVKNKYLCEPYARKKGTSIISCILCPAAGIATYIALSLTNISIINITTLTLLTTAIVLGILKPQYSKSIIANGVFLAFVWFVILSLTEILFPGFVEHTWNPHALSGVFLWLIPIEEITFTFAAGACFAAGYECLFNCSYKMKKM